MNLDICYGPSSAATVIGYSDSGWVGCCSTGKSSESFFFMISGGLISLGSKKQGCGALYSCVAEYISLFTALKKTMWLPDLLYKILGANLPKPISIFVGSSELISSSKKKSITKRNKHISILYHLFGEALAGKKIPISYC